MNLEVTWVYINPCAEHEFGDDKVKMDTALDAATVIINRALDVLIEGERDSWAI